MLGIALVILGAVVAIGFPYLMGLFIPLLMLSIVPVGLFLALSYRGRRMAHEHNQRLRVLVVDDDEISVTPLLTALSSKSADINFVQSGDQMLSALKSEPYDLIFLDHMMPDINGEDALKISEQSVASNKKVAVIFYTGAVKTFYLPKDLDHFEVKGVWDKMVPFRVLDERLETLWHQRAA